MLLKVRSWSLIVLLGVSTVAISCRPTTPPSPVPPPAQPPAPVPQPMPATSMTPTTQPFTAMNLQHVHNVHRVTDKLISGSAPDDDQGMKEIADLGVKTIISVDGMTPDVASAHKYGMTYVHLPFGYDGIPEDRAREIAKAIRDLPGPIYIHCHHGMHRSAAAVATACVINGMIAHDRAEEVLRTFGTGLNYKGLWRNAREARPLDDATLEATPVVYAEVTPIPPMAQQMLKIDAQLDRLKAIQKAGWQAPPNHPDFDPPHEALLLQERLTELARTPEADKEPAEYHRFLQASTDSVSKLREALAGKSDKATTDAAMKTATQSCLNCHAVYRD
jgi:protein tyrosine phosphatase (PTP) superfamily phosphohydrolase (DUF442 family)